MKRIRWLVVQRTVEEVEEVFFFFFVVIVIVVGRRSDSSYRTQRDILYDLLLGTAIEGFSSILTDCFW